MSLDVPIPDLIAALFGGGAVVLGLVLGAILLVGRGPHSIARRFLGGFLVAAGLTLANELISTLQLQRLSAHFYITPLVYTYSLGPLIYVFVRSRLVPERRLRRGDLVHAVLPLFQIVLEVVTGFAPMAFKSWYWRTPFSQGYNQVDTVLFVASFGAYLLVSWRLLRTSGHDEEVALWLRRLVAGCAVIVLFALVMETPLVAPPLSEAVGEGAFSWLRLVELMAYAALLYWVAFTGFVHTLHRRPEETTRERRETYGMSPDDLARHAAHLRQHLETERPYLDPDLTLGSLADALHLGEKELSFVLNEGVGTGYTEYVNGLRVAEARRLLADPSRAGDPVLRLGMEAGFASKATFNRVFKQVTGQTPTQFRASSLDDGRQTAALPARSPSSAGEE